MIDTLNMLVVAFNLNNFNWEDVISRLVLEKNKEQNLSIFAC